MRHRTTPPGATPLGFSSGPSALILANGEPPSLTLLRALRRVADIFVCADGGANVAARASLRPDLIIGDFDSVSRATLRTFRSVPSRRLRDQESTDLEKAIRWLLRSGVRRITIAGATGTRLDHVAGNLSVIGKFARRADIRALDDCGELLPVGRRRSLDYPIGTTISLIPLSKCVGVTTQGLRWELRNAGLELGVRDGTSNRTVARPATVRLRKGTLLLYRVRAGGARCR